MGGRRRVAGRTLGQDRKEAKIEGATVTLRGDQSARASKNGRVPPQSSRVRQVVGGIWRDGGPRAHDVRVSKL